jgi:hypothetical protein
MDAPTRRFFGRPMPPETRAFPRGSNTVAQTFEYGRPRSMSSDDVRLQTARDLSRRNLTRSDEKWISRKLYLSREPLIDKSHGRAVVPGLA